MVYLFSRGICLSDATVKRLLKGSGVVEGLTMAYWKIYETQRRKQQQDYFGLRDYYRYL